MSISQTIENCKEQYNHHVALIRTIEEKTASIISKEDIVLYFNLLTHGDDTKSYFKENEYGYHIYTSIQLGEKASTGIVCTVEVVWNYDDDKMVKQFEIPYEWFTNRKFVEQRLIQEFYRKKNEAEKVKLSKEHDDFRWVSTLGEVELMVLPELYRIISQVLNADKSITSFPKKITSIREIINRYLKGL